MTELIVYAIRISPRAEDDILTAASGLAALAGSDVAAEWEQGLFQQSALWAHCLTAFH